MAKSDVQMSWGGVSVTPLGGSAIPINEIVDVQVHMKDNLEMWQADGHKFATLVVAASGERGGTLVGGDVAKLTGMPKGTACTVTATFRDALNGVGTGALIFTWANAVFDDMSASGQSNKFGGGKASFSCFSPDGFTDPLTIVQVG